MVHFKLSQWILRCTISAESKLEYSKFWNLVLGNKRYPSDCTTEPFHSITPPIEHTAVVPNLQYRRTPFKNQSFSQPSAIENSVLPDWIFLITLSIFLALYWKNSICSSQIIWKHWSLNEKCMDYGKQNCSGFFLIVHFTYQDLVCPWLLNS